MNIGGKDIISAICVNFPLHSTGLTRESRCGYTYQIKIKYQTCSKGSDLKRKKNTNRFERACELCHMFREKISVVSLHRSSTTCSLVTETDELLFIKMQQTTHLSFQFVSTAEIRENKWGPPKKRKKKERMHTYQ